MALRRSPALGAAACLLLLSLLSSQCLGLRPVPEQAQRDSEWSGRMSRVMRTARGLLGREWAQAEGESLVPQALQIPTGDAWCGGRVDGSHADLQASKPCSGYFQCRGGVLLSLHACPDGLEYSNPRQACVQPEASSCQEHSEGVPRRSTLSLGKAGGGFNYQSNGAVLDQTNALLGFKYSVIDFKDALASWIPPRDSPFANRTTTTTTGQGGSSSAGAGGGGGGGAACKGGALPEQCCWKYVRCSVGGSVVALEVPPSRLSTPLGQNSIPPLFGALTALRRLSLAGDPQQALFGLTGSLPRELSSLRNLTFLDLSNNRLTGSLGASGVPFLTALRWLDLHSNWLSGEIPDSIGGLKDLRFLDLQDNGLEGALPSSLGGLRKLVTLNATQNKLAGPIPPELGDAAALQTVYLPSNQLEGGIPAALSRLASLTGLSLHYNRLNGTVPSGMSALTSLVSVQLMGNELSGELPLSALCTTGLFGLNLAQNKFTGGLKPKEYAKCKKVSNFNVSNNELSGTLDATMFSGAYHLSFGAASNRFTGRLPSSLLSLTYMASSGNGLLDLSNNSFSGPLPSSLLCPYFLGLAYNALSGPLPLPLLNCSGLNFLDLSHNRFNGTLQGLEDATQFSVKFLYLRNNSLSGPWPSLARAKDLPANLAALDASHNAFTGPLPDLSKCSVLNTLDLSNNAFDGQLDPALLPSRQLGQLNVSNNALGQALPGSVSALSALQELNISGNGMTGSLPASLTSLRRLKALDASRNSLEGVPAALGASTALEILDLSQNAISGPIPKTFAPPGLPALAYLDLSDNELNGSIPYGFANASASKVYLNFANNRLCGPVPDGTLSEEYDASSFEGNQCLCQGPGLGECTDPSGGSSLSAGAIAGIVIGAVAVLGLCLGGLWFCLFYRRGQSVWEGGTMLVFEKMDFPLTIQHVIDSTENFDDKYMLGRGGFGSVYRGTLADGRTVAIKRLAAGSGQGQKEFQAEMQTLGNIRHRNLVVLVAAYVTRPPSSEKLLIYEFLSGGSLDRVLTKDLGKDSPFRKWEVRKKIIEDTARGLKYLHHDCTPRIVHRDMKPANVLLDDKLGARVADFGLAREFDVTKSHVSTSVFGTIGYLAPEYTTRGRLSFKSDVFAFGVMVLQVVTGKQPTDADVAERGLARWVGGGSPLSVCDPKIEDAAMNLNEIMGVITLGLRCTARVPGDRPSMEEVVYSLDHIYDFARGFGKGKIEPFDKA